MIQPGMLWPASEGQVASMPAPLPGALGCQLSSYIGESHWQLVHVTVFADEFASHDAHVILT